MPSRHSRPRRVDLSQKAPPGGVDWNHLGHQYYRTEARVRDASGLIERPPGP